MTALAGPNDPLVLRNGKQIDPTTGRTVKQSSGGAGAVPASSSVAGSTASPTRRRIEDMKIPPAALTSIMVVAAMKLCNFDPIDIVEALGTSPEMMMAVENHSDYVRVQNLLIESVQEIAKQDARGILAAAAPAAARVLAEHVDADDEVLSQTAAIGLLDRVIGRTPENGQASGNSFRIEIVDKRDDVAAGVTIKVGV